MRLPSEFQTNTVARWYREVAAETGPLDAAALFPVARPLELEVGVGKGRFLMSAAEAWPESNFLGIEIRVKSALFTAWRAARRDLDNLFMLRGDARVLLHERLPARTFEALHFYFPDPWWKQRHQKRRVYQKSTFADFARVLKPGGRLHLASDVAHVFEEMVALAEKTPGFVRLQTDAAILPVTTNFEDKAARDGRPVQRAAYRFDPPPEGTDGAPQSPAASSPAALDPHHARPVQ